MSDEASQPGDRVAFVCVQNAGRSQMAYAFAQKERAERDAKEQVTLMTGGTQPADHVHKVVADVMQECNVDLSDRTPREVTPDELQDTDIVITMGCSASNVCPATWNGENRDWDLDDPDDRPLEEVREIRDEIEHRVEELFDELLTAEDQH